VEGAVGDMNGATQQTAAVAEQTNAASNQLAHEANDLTRLVAHFRFDGFERVATRADERRRCVPRCLRAIVAGQLCSTCRKVARRPAARKASLNPV
jgi:hypothetical protein